MGRSCTRILIGWPPHQFNVRAATTCPLTASHCGTKRAMPAALSCAGRPSPGGEGTPGGAQPAAGTPSQAYDERPAVARGSYLGSLPGGEAAAAEAAAAEPGAGGRDGEGAGGGKGARRAGPAGRALEYTVTAPPGDPAGAAGGNQCSGVFGNIGFLGSRVLRART